MAFSDYIYIYIHLADVEKLREVGYHMPFFLFILFFLCYLKQIPCIFLELVYYVYISKVTVVIKNSCLYSKSL